jgi:hypothetical protein
VASYRDSVNNSLSPLMYTTECLAISVILIALPCRIITPCSTSNVAEASRKVFVAASGVMSTEQEGINAFAFSSETSALSGLHDVTSYKMQLFITSAVGSQKS